jgi:hypothetical protein
MIPTLNTDNNFSTLKNYDTFYIFPEDFKFNLENITIKEDKISNSLLSIIQSNKDDQELINLTIKPIDLYYILIELQRQLSVNH